MLTVVVGAYNGTSKVRVVATDDVDEEPQKVIFSLPISEALTPGRIKWVKLIRGAIRHFGGDPFKCRKNRAKSLNHLKTHIKEYYKIYHFFSTIISNISLIS